MVFLRFLGFFLWDENDENPPFLLEPTHHCWENPPPDRPGAKAAAVKKSFRQLALRFHPDKNLNSSELPGFGERGREKVETGGH